MKLQNLLEVLLILIIVSFAASKPIDKENGRAVHHRNHVKKGLIARQEPVDGAPAKPVVPAEEDDDDFDITDIFDVFDDDDEEDEEESVEEESAEEVEDDDEEADDDDSDSDEEEDEVEEEAETAAAGGASEPDAFDLIAELLEDEETPKPKPSTAAPEVVAQSLDVAQEAADEVDDDVEDEAEAALEPVVTIQKVPEKKPTPKPTKAAKKPKTTTTTEKSAPEKADLPPLNLQNTSALLELQAQLTANNVKGGDLEDEDEKVATPKPTKKPTKKKTQTQKIQKKQASSNDIEVAEKPIVIEDGVVMEKVHLKTPEGEKMKIQQQEDESEEGVEIISS